MRATLGIAAILILLAAAVAFFWNFGRTDRTHIDPVMSSEGASTLFASDIPAKQPPGSAT